MTRSTVQRQFGSDFAYDRRELKAMAREAAAQDKVPVIRMVIDHEIFVGRERIHAGLGLTKSLRCARHPLFQGLGDGLDVARPIHVAIDVLRVRQIAGAVKGGFDAVSKIGEAIERRGKTAPINQERWEPRRLIGVSRRRKPRLDIALHADANT